MSSCLITRTKVIVALGDGRRLEVSREPGDTVESITATLRGLIVLDEIWVDLSVARSAASEASVSDPSKAEVEDP
jgi:hypothetical protein